MILIWNQDDSQSSQSVASLQQSLLVADSTPWENVFRTKGVSVLHQSPHYAGSHVHPLANLHGVVIGSLFRRTSEFSATPALTNFDESETRRILNSSGRHLVKKYWGSYVALLHDERCDSTSILRDPTASLPCYHTRWNGIQVIFSDLDDIKRNIAMRLSINWSHIAARLLRGEVLSRDCSLNEIEDLPGGELLTISRQTQTRTTLWHPAEFCVDNSLEDEHKAATELRSTVVNAVRTLALGHSDIMVRLSGGLDSSIVASCFADQDSGPRLRGINFYVAGHDSGKSTGPIVPGLNREDRAKVRRIVGGADERQFARCVARKFGFPLTEFERRVDDYDIRKMWNTPVAPRPSTYMLMLDVDQTEISYAARHNVTACFTGEAGDTVFYNTLRAIGAIDYAYSHPLNPHVFRHIQITAALSGESIARISAKVLKYGYLRAIRPLLTDLNSHPHLIADEIAENVPTERFNHPWIDSTPPLCPGKREHVVGVALSVPNYQHVYHADRIAVSVHPLASQPVVETCLRIPTYVLLADGISRGLARRAFRDVLPPEVVRRTVKGYAIPFWQRIVRQNMPFIRECLLDGILTRNGVLDRGKLEDYLIDDQPFLTVQAPQILEYLGSEAWLAQWIRR